MVFSIQLTGLNLVITTIICLFGLLAIIITNGDDPEEWPPGYRPHPI